RLVTSGACAVRYFLAERHPELVFTALRWVESVIVFTHPLSRLEANQGQTIVVSYSHLFQAVLELARKQRLEPAIAEQLVHTLVASQTPGAAGRRARAPHSRVLIRSTASSVCAREP